MECSPIPAKVIASCFSLVAFAAAVTIGYAVDNPTATILYRALLTMLLCWPVGYAVGAVAQRVNEKAIADYKERNPMTVDHATLAEAPSPAPGNDAAPAPTQERNSPSSPTA
jgi:hypothetical protein